MKLARRHSSIIAAAAVGTGAILIDSIALLCPESGDACPVFIDDRTHPIWQEDGNHLSAWGAKRIANEIAAVTASDLRADAGPGKDKSP